MKWIYSPGVNRERYINEIPDCCYARALSNAMNLDYKEAYDLISKYIEKEELDEKYKSNDRNSICKDVIKKVLVDMGWQNKSLMVFGQGTSHHICEKDLPKGSVIAQISKGITFIKDGVLFDKYDVSRNNTRCCYSIWTKNI